MNCKLISSIVKVMNCKHSVCKVNKLRLDGYYHLRSTVKRERFFAYVYFSNETVSQTTLSTGPMKMFRLEHETMNVCQRNVACFGHMECRFDKINDFFQGFRSLVSLRLQKDGGAKGKQIWTNLSHWNTGGSL